MSSDWDWSDQSTYVRLPFKDPNSYSTDPNWTRITNALNDLKNKCTCWTTLPNDKYQNVPGWVQDAVSEYNKRAKDACNFRVLEISMEVRRKLIDVLPVIIDYALSLPTCIKFPIEFLQKGKNMTVKLDRNLICSLLANAFMSTLPRQKNPRGDLPSINFWRLFNCALDGRSAVQLEKLKCILEYFEQMGSNKIPNTIISFQRRWLPINIKWEYSTELLSELLLTATGKIENATYMLQVDFANKVIGGGVLKGGAVQEEIRFVISPELIVARLFTEELTKDEAVVITGSRQFSSYIGYGSGFTFKKLEPYRNPVNRIVDNFNREYSQVVAIDAIHFCPSLSHTQYTKSNIDRELHKSYVGFLPGYLRTCIATGNWGCGAFGGDPELKFVIQWIAASQNNRKVLYHAQNEAQFAALESMRNFLVSKQVTLGTLYYILMKYEREALKWVWFHRTIKKKTVFEFLRENLS